MRRQDRRGRRGARSEMSEVYDTSYEGIGTTFCAIYLFSNSKLKPHYFPNTMTIVAVLQDK